MSRRTRSVALIVLLALVLSAAVLLWQLPALVRVAVVRQLEATTGRRASIERLELSLLRGHLAIAGLRIADKASGPPLAEIDRLDVSFTPAALVRAQLHAREATIAGVRVNVVRSEQGALSIADLLNRPPSTGPPAAVTIDKLSVTGGVVTIEDRAVATPRTWRAESLAIEGRALSTIDPGARGTLRLTASVAGAPLAVDVTGVDLTSNQGSAHVTATNVDATVAQIAAPPDTPFVLARAGLTVDLVAGVDGSGAVSLYGGGTLDDVALNRRGSEQPAATAPSLPFLIQGAGTGGKGLGFHRVEVSGSAFLIDPRSNPPASVPVERLQLSLAPKTADAMGDWLVLFSAARKGGGQLEVEGTARPAPLGASVRVRVTKIDLGVWDSLIPLPGRLGGFAEADLTLTVSEGPVARAQGTATLTRLSVHDGDVQLLGAERFDVIGIDAQWPRVKIERLRLAKPTVAAARDAEGRLSLMALVPPAGPPSPRAAAAPGQTLQVEIGELVMSDGTATIDDQKVSPAVRLRVSPFGLTARGITWPSTSPAKVELKAALPIAGTLEATGTATIEPVTVDLRLKLTAAAIGLYQPYLPIVARIRGRLDADLAAKGALEPKIALTMKGTAGVRDLAIGERDKPVITVARIDMTGLDYAWPTTVALDRLRVERSWALLERRADGAIPMMALFRPLAPGAVAPGDPVERVPGPRPPDGVAPKPPPPPAFDVSVRESVLENGAVTIADAMATPPVRAEITGVRLEARDFTWPARRPVPIDLRVPMPGGGTVTAQAQIAAGANTLDGKVTATGVDLAPFAAYVPVRARVAGKASADLAVSLALEPFNVTARGRAGVANVSVSDSNRPLVTAARADVTGLDYTWPATVKVDRVEVQRPAVVLERRADGALPIRDLLLPRGAARSGATTAAASPDAAPTASAAAPPRIDVAVREAVIAGGSAAITDASVTPAARFDLGDLRVTARDVTWPVRGPVPVQVSAAVPGGGTARAEGQVAAGASGGTMKVTLRDVDLAIARSYVPISGVVAGKAGADLDVTAALEPFDITARGTASVADLTVSDAQRPLVKAPRVEVTGLTYAWPAKLTVERLRATGSSVLLERAADGTLGLMSLLEPPPAPAARPAPRGAQTPAAPSPPIAPEIDVRLAQFQDAAVTVVDASVRPPTRVEITGARLSARDLTWPARTPATVQVRVPTPGNGSVDASGQVKLDASHVDLTLALSKADIAAAAPYLPVRARVNGWADGRITVKGSLNPLAVAVTGSVTIWDALLADGPRPLATAKQIDVNGIDVDWPKRVAIEKLAFRLPWLLAERGPDNSIPLLDAILPQDSPAPASGTAKPASAATPATATAPAPPLSIQIGSASVEEGFVRFVDASVKPSFVEEASRIMSSAQRLSTAPNASSPIAVKGKLSGNASFEFTGSVGPVMGPLGLDVQGNITNLALTHLNPYLNLYLGWIARRGVLSMTVDYKIKNDQLDAKQDVVIGQPEFAPSRSGGAVREKLGVPLDTLISLLKNSRGEVKITAPVTGTVSARQFDFGDAVWAGVRKTVINVLALPVSWVGKVLYTEDARIDTIRIWPITFDAGTTQIRRDLAPQAERLAGFLKDAPGVSLLLKPVATSEDVQSMARSQVRARISALAVQSNEPPASAAAKLWAETFRERPAPEGLDAIVDALAKAEPPTQAAIAALAKSRIDALKKELGARGVDVARLRESEGTVPVEASGEGRVEFEIVS